MLGLYCITPFSTCQDIFEGDIGIEPMMLGSKPSAVTAWLIPYCYFVGCTGFEPVAYGLKDHCSNQMS